MVRMAELGEKIGRGFKAQKVILFGSYAYGKPGSDSDVDLLVVMRYKGKAARKSVEIINSVDPDFSVDLDPKKSADASANKTSSSRK